MIGASGSRGNIEGQRRCTAFVGVEIAHPFYLDEVIKGFFTDLPGCRNAAVGQDVPQPPLALANSVNHLQKCLVISESEVQSVGFFGGDDAKFKKFHGP